MRITPAAPRCTTLQYTTTSLQYMSCASTHADTAFLSISWTRQDGRHSRSSPRCCSVTITYYLCLCRSGLTRLSSLYILGWTDVHYRRTTASSIGSCKGMCGDNAKEHRLPIPYYHPLVRGNLSHQCLSRQDRIHLSKAHPDANSQHFRFGKSIHYLPLLLRSLTR